MIASDQANSSGGKQNGSNSQRKYDRYAVDGSADDPFGMMGGINFKGMYLYMYMQMIRTLSNWACLTNETIGAMLFIFSKEIWPLCCEWERGWSVWNDEWYQF